MKIYPTFYEKSFRKVLLNRKLKKGLCHPFFSVFVQIFAGGGEIANLSPSSLLRSYSFD